MNTKNRPDISIVGGGAAALMLAAQLDTNQYQVTIYEKNKTLGRKLLVAGNGGFNLTHGRNIEEMIHEYYPSDFLSECLQNFSNLHLREYLLKLGIPTYVGSSNRIFPQKGIKPIEVLNAFTTKIHANKVTIKTAYHWKGFQKDGQLLFEHNEKQSTVGSDYVIFALGGASWSKTGSKGDWLPYFAQQKIKTLPFQASNCAFRVDWSKDLLSKIEGQPLKNIALFCADQRRKGELMITAFGLEGSPIYAHSRCLRQQLKNSSKPQLFLDLKPNLSSTQVLEKIKVYKTKKSWTTRLQRSLNLSDTKMALLRHFTTKKTYTDINSISKIIKKLPINIKGIAPIEEAISTVGGISRSAIDQHFQLKALPNHFVIGEMIDWDAPTGGYLLQGCFSMGAWVAQFLNKQYESRTKIH